MSKEFILRAVPDIVPAGQHKGYLAYVTFIATNGETSVRWFSTNFDRYIPDFAKLVDWHDAESIFQKLCKGEKTTFPGVWSLEELGAAEFLGIRSL